MNAEVHPKPRVARRAAGLTATALLGFGLVGVASSPAFAADFDVTNETELIDAINDSNAYPDPDTINITAATPIVLTGDLPAITEQLTITGGPDAAIDADGYGALFVDGAEVVISDLRIDNAGAAGIEAQGAAPLEVRSVVVTNSAEHGVYVGNGGDVTISASTFEGNGWEGAYLFEPQGVVTVSGSTFEENDRDGAFVFKPESAVSVNDADFLSNGTTGSDYGGLRITDPAAPVSLTEIEAHSNDRFGVLVDSTVTAFDVTLHDLVTNDNGTGIGVYAGIAGSVVNGSDLEANGSENRGISVLGRGAEFVLSDLRAADNGLENFEAELEDDSTLQLSNVRAENSIGDSGIALTASGSNSEITHIEATGLSATGNAGSGIETTLSGSAQAEIGEVTADRNANGNYWLDGSGTSHHLLSQAASTSSGDDGISVRLIEDASFAGVGLTSHGDAGAGIMLNGVDRSSLFVGEAVVEGIVSPASGGGLLVFGQGSATFEIVGATVRDNQTSGFGFTLEGDAEVELLSSTSDANTGGPGLMVTAEDRAKARVLSSTISNNTEAGVVSMLDSSNTLDIVNSTVSTNGTADVCGVGILVMGFGTGGDPDTGFELSNSTVADNAASHGCGQVALGQLRASISNSIITGADMDLSIEEADNDISVDYSLVGNVDSGSEAAQAVAAGSGNLTDIDAELGRLRDNGGTTLTHKPAKQSPVVNAGTPNYAGPLSFDQRGEDRVQGGRIDMGSVEQVGVPRPDPVDPPAPHGPKHLANTGGESVAGLLGAGLLMTLLGAGLFMLPRRRT